MSSANTKIYFFLFALLFICFNANALLSQTLSPGSAFLKIYNTVPSVPFNRINDIIQTSDRYLWVAAPEGLFRYDGFRFKSINLPDSSFPGNVNIRTLFEDSQNKLWIGTEKGVLIRRSNGEWDSITTRIGLSNEHIRCIAEDFEGNIWIGTDYGLNKISSNGIEIFNTKDGLYDNIITALSVDIHGFLWIGTLRGGVTQFKEGVIHTFSYEDGLLSPAVYSLAPDKLGNIWIGTMRGVYKLNPRTRLITPEYYLSYTPVTSLRFNDDGVLFIGTMADGIKSTDNGRLLSFNTDNDLPDDYVTSLFIDDNNNLWCGMDVGGLVSLSKPLLFNLTENNGLPKDVITSLLQTGSGSVLIGTRKSGLFLISSLGGKTVEHLETGLLNNPITSLFEDNSDRIWIGTEVYGSKIINGNRSKNLTEEDGLLSNAVTSIYEDQQGVVWIGTNNGLNSYSENEITSTYLNGERINFISEENNELYIGTTNGFIKRDVETGDFTTIFSGFSLLSHFRINKETILFGTEGLGILLWKNGDLKTCSEDNGLPENTIFSITHTDSLNFWISSPKGIFAIRQNILNSYFEGNNNYITAFQLDESNGMSSSFCGKGQYPVISTMDGELLYPTGEGISYFNPDSFEFPDSRGQIIIENIFLDDKMVKETENLLIESAVDKIKIEFTIANLSLSSQFYFKYKIDSDKEEYKYIKPGEERTAIFDNPGAGKYNLILQAANVDGEWEKNSTIIPFKIESPFYTKSWFIFLVTFLMFSLYFVNKYFDKQKMIQEKENKYKTLNIDIERKKSAADKLVRLMEDEKLFLDPNLTLQQLAKKFNLHYNHLSRIINEMFGVSFNDFINRYRIEEAKKKLKDPEIASQNILEIMYSCGFYSKSVFNTAFKKFTGKTPSQYRRSS